jgi:hypothetical protein
MALWWGSARRRRDCSCTHAEDGFAGSSGIAADAATVRAERAGPPADPQYALILTEVTAMRNAICRLESILTSLAVRSRCR